jgi:hypothetical protein
MKTIFIVLIIWAIGYVLSAVYGIRKIAKDNNRKILWNEVFYVLVLSLCSWISLLIMFIGYNSRVKYEKGGYSMKTKK